MGQSINHLIFTGAETSLFMVGSRTTSEMKTCSGFQHPYSCWVCPYHARLGKVGYGDYVPHSFPGYVSVAWEKLLFFESHSLGKDEVFLGGGNSNSLYFQPDPWGKMIQFDKLPTRNTESSMASSHSLPSLPPTLFLMALTRAKASYRSSSL